MAQGRIREWGWGWLVLAACGCGGDEFESDAPASDSPASSSGGGTTSTSGGSSSTGARASNAQGAASNRAEATGGGAAASNTAGADSSAGSAAASTAGAESSAGATTSSAGSTATTTSIDDPLFTSRTETVSEWVTDEWYTCETEQSACALPCSDGDLWVAINETDFRNSATCGACMHVTGPNGEVLVEVIENCAGACVDGEIELSRTAFDTIADLEEGRADVSWQLVPCQHTEPIQFTYEAESDEWWAGIQVRRTNLPVATLAILLPEEGWVELERDGWNHFPITANLGAGPFDFRVTAIDGQELLEEGIEYVPGGVVTGQGQFE